MIVKPEYIDEANSLFDDVKITTAKVGAAGAREDEKLWRVPTAKKRRLPKLAGAREDEKLWRAPADDRQFSNLEDRGGPAKNM